MRIARLRPRLRLGGRAEVEGEIDHDYEQDHDQDWERDQGRGRIVLTRKKRLVAETWVTGRVVVVPESGANTPRPLSAQFRGFKSGLVSIV